MNYIGNAFSLGMLDCLAGGEVILATKMLTAAEAREWYDAHAPASCVGHADTGELISSILDREVKMNRCSTSLARGDALLVGQYNGPRLPEGAKSLPEGAKLRWILVEVQAQ